MANAKRAAQIMQPGPILDDVLHMQNIHRSQFVWQNEDEAKILRCQVATNSLMYANVDERLHNYIRRAGFEEIVKVGGISVDYSLITALVERWRPETHTFHLTVGEATITLQDVEVLTGLRVDGNAVTGSANYNFAQTCELLLGVVPPPNVMRGKQIKLTWLDTQFQYLQPNARDDIVRCYARAFLLRVIGGLLFGGKNSGYVHFMWLPLLNDFDEAGQYAWGAATLAHLYREMCKATKPDILQISGCLQLLQVWACERIPKIAPRAQNQFSMDKSYSFR
ncbi:serine/threonine-protein phosphatase 7 long form homolog [Euphorbia lathyris]|uniref:serine/threonine-protein phosphatase 7 long form homolog n=1 Tax=Euphorbia lathyris TaxID=212925 RepID=UPI00331406D8